MRRARRTDANHSAIAKAAERLGVVVHKNNADWDQTWQLGSQYALIEVKNPDSARGKREIKSGGNERQQAIRIHREIVTCMDDVARVVGMLRKRQSLVFNATLAD